MTDPARELSAEEMRAALDRVSDGVLVLDRQWRVTFVNTGGAGMLARSADELRGHRIWDFFPEGEGGRHQDWFQRAMDTQEAVRFERLTPRLGRWFDIRAYPSPEGLTVVFRDITYWRRLREEREEALGARKQFEALVEASSDFIAVFDSATRTLRYLNPAGRMLLGIAPGVDVSGMSYLDLNDAAGTVFLDDVVLAAVGRNGRWSGYTTLRHQQTGALVPVQATHYAIADPETGAHLAYATVQRDVSERLAAEQRLLELAARRRELMARLVEAQEVERATIAAGVHDDSVQALAAVDIRLGLLQRKITAVAPELSEQVREAQRVVTAATSRLRHLLFDLEPPHPGETLVAGLERAAGYLLEDTAVEYRLVAGPGVDLPDPERVQAQRIAKEAIGNASRHAGATRVEIEVRQVDDGVEVAISDDGVGVGTTALTSPPGHRGLTTMRDRAEIAGGWCRLEQRAPQGTTVRFWLPREPIDDAGSAVVGEQLQPGRG